MRGLYRVTEIRENVWHIEEGGLDSMYVIKGEKRGLIIDTGTGVGDFKKLAENLLGKENSLPYDVVLTHGHVDHAGGGSQFEKIFVGEGDKEIAAGISLKDREDYIKRMKKVGASQISPEEIEPCQQTKAKAEYIEIGDGFLFSLGDREIQVFQCPGHTLGSICLLDEKDKLLFSGDNMNDIELLCAPFSDRKELLRKWYDCASFVLKEPCKFELCCGGHSVFSVAKAKEILECGEKVLKGELSSEFMEVHIFKGNFARYKDSYLIFEQKIEEIMR